MLAPGANSTAEMAAAHLAVAAREPFTLRVTLRDGSSSRFVHLDFRCGLPPPHFPPPTLSPPAYLHACLPALRAMGPGPHTAAADGRAAPKLAAGRPLMPRPTPPRPPHQLLAPSPRQAGHQRPPERWHPADRHPQLCPAQGGRGRRRRPLQGCPLLCSGAGGCAAAAAEAAR